MPHPRTVPVFGEPARAAALGEALEARGFVATFAPPSSAAGLLAEAPPAAVLVASPGADVLAEAAGLLAACKARSVPLVVVLASPDPAVRDRLLVGGVTDLSLEGHPDEVAARVDAAVEGWIRAAPRRPLPATFRAQRGRDTFDLRVVDIDPSGFAVGNAELLSVGELLRVAVPLPGGGLVAWARAAESDGTTGVRFLALTREERERLVAAIQGRHRQPGERTVAPGAAMSAAATASPVPPAAEPAPAVPAQAEAEPAPAQATAEEAAPAPSEPVEAPAPQASAPAALESAPVEAAASRSPQAIAEAIGEVLGEDADDDVVLLDDSPQGASREPVGEWPGQVFESAVLEAAIATAVRTGLVSHDEGLPAERIVAFVRELAPLERRAFEVQPPAELEDPALLRRILTFRLHASLLARDAATCLAERGPGWVVRAESLAALAGEADGIHAELQSASDRHLAEGQSSRIRDLKPLRLAVARALDEVKVAAARLRGEEVEEDTSAVLLDSELPQVTQPPAARRAPVEEPRRERTATRPVLVPEAVLRQRRRMVLWIVLIVLFSAAYVVFRPERPRRFGPDMAGGVAGVTEVVLHQQKVTVRVEPGWKAEPATVDALRRAILRADENVTAIIVIGENGRVLAGGRAREPLRIVHGK